MVDVVLVLMELNNRVPAQGILVQDVGLDAQVLSSRALARDSPVEDVGQVSKE